MNVQRTIMWWSTALVVCLVMAACGATNAGTTGTDVDDSAQSNEEMTQPNEDSTEDTAMETTDAFVGTEWQLVAYGAPASVQMPLPDYLPTIRFDATSLSGNAGCNTYGGDYTISGSDLTVADLFATEMACADQGAMDQEMAYLQLLSAVQTFTLADGKLTLNAPDGTLVFETPKTIESQPLEGAVWQLETLVTFEADSVAAQPVTDGASITALFQLGTLGGSVEGSTGCNDYSGSYRIDNFQITVPSAFTNTEAECIDDTAREQEEQFLTGIQTAESYRIDGDVLTITHPDGELVFRVKGDTSADPNAVYATILREWQGARDAFVVLNETRFNTPDQDMDATIAALQELPPLSDEVATLDETLLTDFREKNAESQSLDSTFSIDFPTIFMNQADIDDIFVDGEEAGWQTFNERFGNTDGYVALSNVGFSEGGNEALVYLELHSPDDTAGFYNTLFLQNGTWVVVQSNRIWGDE
ncbi:MAG: hypothetical protein GFH24_608316n70 [Chloroflexi bacterium AL-N5]|nr:hypothetical protein [Chloroflexi bacterium AL-N5]